MSEDPIGAGDVGWLQQRARAIAPREQWPSVAQFFAGLVPCAGLATLDATGVTSEHLRRGLGLLIADDDPVLGPYFELRDRLDDERFDAIWPRKHEMRWGVLGVPGRPPLLRLTVDAAVVGAEGGGRRRLVRHLLLCPDQLGEDLLLRFSEAGCGLWLVPLSTAVRERARGTAGSLYDCLSHCLPIGRASGTRIENIARALDWLHAWREK